MTIYNLNSQILKCCPRFLLNQRWKSLSLCPAAPLLDVSAWSSTGKTIRRSQCRRVGLRRTVVVMRSVDDQYVGDIFVTSDERVGAMPIYGKYVCLWPYMGTPQRHRFLGGLKLSTLYYSLVFNICCAMSINQNTNIILIPTPLKNIPSFNFIWKNTSAVVGSNCYWWHTMNILHMKMANLLNSKSIYIYK
jgi:hypothetical protein